MDFHETLLEEIASGKIADKAQLQKRKIQLCRELHMETLPPNSETLARASEELRPLVRGGAAPQARAHSERRRCRRDDDLSCALPARPLHLLPRGRRERLAPVVHRQGAGGQEGDIEPVRTAPADREEDGAARGDRPWDREDRPDRDGRHVHLPPPRLPGVVRQGLLRRDERDEIR